MSAAPTAADLERFRSAIANRLGLDVDEGKLGFLADVLRRRLDASRRDADQYLDRLERGPTADELDPLVHELTVPETYFFRHFDQVRAFAEIAIPDRIKARGNDRRLRILSAGCASGEEPYTLAMMLHDLPIDPSWDVSILAVDLNRGVLEKAAGGRFSNWSLRETPPQLEARWFRPSGRDLQLDDSIRARVTFEQRNLAQEDAELWRREAFDVVFCRNVIMYFTPRTAQEVVDRISRSLAPGGYLFLGHAETLRGMTHDFHLCHTHSAFYYQRKGPGRANPERAARSSQPPPLQWVADPLAMADSWVDAISRASDRIRVLADKESAMAPAPVAVPPCDLQRPLELLRQERFGEALGLVRSFTPEAAADPDIRLLEAVLLVHSGQLDQAEQACVALLQLDELNAGAHYVIALCCERAGDLRGAVEHDQIAAYLDPGFAMPRLHLGLMARRTGDKADARRELGQAFDLLQREDASRLLFFGGGFSRDALIALCRDALVACGGRA